MSKVLPTIVITFIIIFTLVAFLGIGNVFAQDASTSATLTPTGTPTETPTPTSEPTPTEDPSPTPTVEPTPTEEPASESEESESDGEVLGGATELGDTSSGKQATKWIVAAFIGIAVALIGVKITRNHVDE